MFFIEKKRDKSEEGKGEDELKEPPSKKSCSESQKIPPIESLEDEYEPEVLDSMYSMEELQSFCSHKYISMPANSKKEDFVKTVADYLKEHKKALQTQP